MGLAVSEFFHARWSEEIFRELKRNLLKKSRLTEAVTEARVQQLQHLLPEAMVTPSKAALRAAKNDYKDRHVVAAAISSEAEFIITLNVKDFEPLPAGIKAMTPDAFLKRFTDQKSKIIGVLEWVASNWPEPPPLEYLLRKLEPFVPELATALQHRT